MARPPGKARDIARRLRQDVESGDIEAPGGWLPSRAELAERYEAAEGTVKQALDELTEDAYVVQVPGRGARLRVRVKIVQRSSGHQTQTRGRNRGFALAAEDAGATDWYDTYDISDVPIPARPAELMNLPEGLTVLRRARTHGIFVDEDRVPVMLSWTWIHPAIAEQLPVLRTPDTGSGGMTSRFIDAGYRVHWQEYVSARAATEDEAAGLEIEPGAPVLDIYRPCISQDDEVLEVTRRVINSALHEILYP